MNAMILHLTAQFAALAHAHGLTLHQAHGDAGWVLWVQPRHGASMALAQIRGHIVAWVGRRS